DITGLANAGVGGVDAIHAITSAAKSNNYRSKTTLADKITALLADPLLEIGRALCRDGGYVGAGITGAQVKAGITAYIAREAEVNNYCPFIAALIAHSDITGLANAGVGGVDAIHAITSAAKSNNYRSKTTLADKITALLADPLL